MPVNFKTTSYPGGVPVIWRGEAKVLPGGFVIENRLGLGEVVKRGTLVRVDFANHSAAVVKASEVLPSSTTTKVRVAKGGLWAVGDVICKVGKKDASATISSINTANPDYDELSLSGSGLATLTAKDKITESNTYEAESVSAGPKYMPNAVVNADLLIRDKLDTLDAAYDALLITKNLPYPVLEEWKQGICLRDNPNIIFIEQ